MSEVMRKTVFRIVWEFTIEVLLCFPMGSEGNSLQFIQQFMTSLPEENRYKIF